MESRHRGNRASATCIGRHRDGKPDKPRAVLGKVKGIVGRDRGSDFVAGPERKRPTGTGNEKSFPAVPASEMDEAVMAVILDPHDP